MARPIVVEIIGNAKEFTKATNEAVTSSEGMGHTLSKVGMATAAFAVAGIAAITAFGVETVLKTVEAGQAAYQMGEKFGLAGQQASQWLTVARHVGVDSAMLGSGFKFLAKNVEGLNLQFESTGKVGKGTAQVFKDIGINVFDAKGHIKDANELMLESADVFAKMPNGIEKTGLALKLFGKQGMEMLPMLNLGRKGLEDMMAAGKKTGEVMSNEQVEAAHKFFLAQQKLNSELTGFTTIVGTALMPIAASFISWLVGTAIPAIVAFARPIVAAVGPALKELATNVIPKVVDVVKKLVDTFQKFVGQTIVVLEKSGWLKPILLGIAVAFGIMGAAALIAAAASILALWPIYLIILVIVGVVAVLKWAWDHNFLGMKTTLLDLWAKISPTLTKIKDWLGDHLPGVLKILGGAAKLYIALVITVFMILWDIAGKVISGVIAFIKGIGPWFSWLGTKAHAMVTAVGGFFKDLGTKAHDFVEKVKTKFSDLVTAVKNMPGKIKSAASGMWNGITSAFKSMLNGIIGMWNGLHFTVPSILGSPAFTVNLPNIPTFHSGGMVPGSGDVLAMLKGGEQVLTQSQQRGGRGYGDIHIHIDQGAYIDGPSIDMLANRIAARLRFAPGT